MCRIKVSIIDDVCNSKTVLKKHNGNDKDNYSDGNKNDSDD